MSSDLVVVTFSKDIELCRLFIRSADHFVKPGIFNNFWIIITDDSELNFEIDRKWNIVRAKNLFDLSKKNNSGYINQQRAKLEIAKLITSDWYWIFDSKNFFIREIDNNDLYDNNKARVNVTRPSNDWRQSWLNSLQHFDLPYTDPIHNRTPYPVKTSIAQALECNFEPLWFEKGICEFFLYNAWTLKQNQFDVYYPDDRIFNTTLWPIDLSMEIYRPGNLKIVLNNPHVAKMPVWSTGLHRTTIQSMSGEQQQEWAEFLCYLKLFNNIEDVYGWYEAVRLAAQEK